MDLKKMFGELAVTGFLDRRTGMETTGSFDEKFEVQRKNIGRGYGLGNEIRELSKKGIAALKSGDQEEVARCKEKSLELWTELGTIDVPADIAWKFDAENGQEMVEFFFVCVLYDDLFPENSEREPKLPSHGELKVTPQAWLAGIGDAVSELGKIAVELLLGDNLTFEKMIALRKQYLKIAKQAYSFLDEFETAYAMVINNNRYRGFFNNYRGLLFRIARIIADENKELALLLGFEAKMNEVVSAITAAVQGAAKPLSDRTA